MSNTTESNIYSAFIILANALNKPVYIGESTLKKLKKANPYFIEPKHLVNKYMTVGSWSLNHGSYGWQIQEMANDCGGISHPLTGSTLKKTEFYYAVHFALSVLRVQQQNDRDKITVNSMFDKIEVEE